MSKSLERVVLFSLSYNNILLDSVSLRAAIQSQNRAEAWYQIRYAANKGSLADPRQTSPFSGVAKRRFYEAHIFGLSNDDNQITVEEAKNFADVYLRYRDTIDAYEKKYADAIVKANSDFFPSQIIKNKIPTFSQISQRLSLKLAEETALQGQDLSQIERVIVGAQASNTRRLLSEAARYTLTGSEGYNTLIFSIDQPTVFIGTSGNNIIFGGNHDNTFIASKGNNTLISGSGRNRYEISDAEGINEIHDQGASQLFYKGRKISGQATSLMRNNTDSGNDYLLLSDSMSYFLEYQPQGLFIQDSSALSNGGIFIKRFNDNEFGITVNARVFSLSSVQYKLSGFILPRPEGGFLSFDSSTERLSLIALDQYDHLIRRQYGNIFYNDCYLRPPIFTNDQFIICNTEGGTGDYYGRIIILNMLVLDKNAQIIKKIQFNVQERLEKMSLTGVLDNGHALTSAMAIYGISLDLKVVFGVIAWNPNEPPNTFRDQYYVIWYNTLTDSFAMMPGKLGSGATILVLKNSDVMHLTDYGCLRASVYSASGVLNADRCLVACGYYECGMDLLYFGHSFNQDSVIVIIFLRDSNLKQIKLLTIDNLGKLLGERNMPDAWIDSIVGGPKIILVPLPGNEIFFAYKKNKIIMLM